MHPRQLLQAQAPLVALVQAIQTVRVSLAVLVDPLVAQAGDSILATGEASTLPPTDHHCQPRWKERPYLNWNSIRMLFPYFA